MMKRGLAGLVLGILGIASSADAKFILPKRVNPDLKVPYEYFTGILNDVYPKYPGIAGISIKSQDKKRMLNIETDGEDVIQLLLSDSSYRYTSAGLYGQVNSVWKRGMPYIINRVGRTHPLPVHTTLIYERIFQEYFLMRNPVDVSDVAAITSRNINFQRQFELCIQLLYADKDLDVRPVIPTNHGPVISIPSSEHLASF